MEKLKLAGYINSIVYLTDEQLDLILGYFKEFHFKKNKILVSEGEINSYMNFVVSGCVRSYFVTEKGQEVTRNIVFEDSFITGLKSFITQRQSVEYLQTLEETVLLRISHKDFYYLLNIVPSWGKFFRSYLESAYIGNIDFYHREATLDVNNRYIELLKINSEIVKRLPNKIVASYLGMTSETLSRVKARLLK